MLLKGCVLVLSALLSALATQAQSLPSQVVVIVPPNGTFANSPSVQQGYNIGLNESRLVAGGYYVSAKSHARISKWYRWCAGRDQVCKRVQDCRWCHDDFQA